MKKLFVILLLVIFTINVAIAQINLDDAMQLSLSVVNQDPDPATTGDIVEVRIGIENIGGKSANNVLVELLLEYPFELITEQDAIQSAGT